MADGRVEFDIVANDKGINKAIRDVTQNIEKESKKWDRAAGDAAGESASAWGAAAGKIVGALSAAGVASIMMKWGKAAIQAASDLQEVQNVVDVTFGDSAGRIDSWAKSAGKQYGLTETAAKRYTSTIGAMLKSQGMADDEIVQTSTDLAGLAADMASFYNLSFDEAFQKIRSGISGETEPLKQLGINMSVVNLEAFAMEKGITKAFSTMSQGEQTALRYQYIMQATADAQGDFARTADGFANASRRVETAIDTIKTKGGEILLPFIADATSAIAGFLSALTSDELTTAMDDFASIDEKTGQKVSAIQKTAQDAEDLTKILEDLSKETDLTGDEQAYWLEICKQLVQTIPGLNAIINTETGEVKGGTDAVREYVKAWEEGQKKLAMMGAIEQKQSALDQRFSALPGLELDAAVAAQRAKKFREYLAKEYGATFDGNGNISYSTSVAMANSGPGSQWFKDVREYTGLLMAQKDAEDVFQQQKDAYYEATEALNEYREVVEEMPGDTKAAADATKEWTTEQEALGQAAVEATQKALTALADYVQGVHDATEQAVNGIVKGFDAIERPTTDLLEKRSKLIEQQNELNRSTKEGEQKYQELQKQIDALNGSLDQYSPKGMQDALQSQLAFMDEYIKNLEEAKRLGLSDELLASLSDGSVESAEYLAQLVANPEQASAVDALYQQVQEKKGEFTDVLTEQKLAIDDTYDAMVQKAEEASNAMAAVDDSVGGDIEDIAKAISAHVPEVKLAVDDVIAQLDRLNNFGVSVSFGSFGSFAFRLNGEHETGLDYVPFDGYLAGLHEGEGILTAEENRIWQRFKNGQPSGMDYDTLGATMRDNVKAGGNVYLDGRVVGSVISDAQGKSYRALQRSGWQE